jgi:acyl carrier protein
MADEDTVKGKMATLLRQPVEKLTDDTLLTDLVTDSFLLVQMVIELQEEFGVRLVQEDLKDVKTVNDLTCLFEMKSIPKGR